MENRYFIKIQGKANIPSELAIGHNYKVEADCSITSEQKNDNEDGTFDIVYKVEPITASIQKDNGVVVKAKDPRRNSQKIRNSLYRDWSNLSVAIDFDRFYDEATNIILKEIPIITDQVLKKLK